MKDKVLKQSSPEEFWGPHLKRHSSASNISNQLFNECVNQNIVFLAHKFGQFSSLENLSTKLYKEHKDDRFYVSNTQYSGGRDANDCSCDTLDGRNNENSLEPIFKTNAKSVDRETKKIKLRKNSSINPKSKSNTINRLMKSFSLKRPKESKNVVYLERFKTLSSDFTDHRVQRRPSEEEYHKLLLIKKSLVTGHLCHHLAELDL